jgi:hypothetical protein
LRERRQKGRQKDPVGGDMAENGSSADHIQKHMLVWVLSVLVVGAAAVFVWWFASDVVVAIINAFEIILWLLGLMLWPFRL